jgi:Putative glycosyl/glycerophosphate transferases involved in teichoic acid biosynthesis TagF/TagB/EpsJ/RodC
MSRILKKPKKLLRIIFFYTCKILFPIKEKVIVFESSVGRSYTGKPRAIYEEMIRNGMDRECVMVWSLNDVGLEVMGNCRKVQREGFLYAYYLAVAKYWIFDGRHPRYFVKRRGTTYLQTWHGTPLKKIGLDLDWVHMNRKDSIEAYKKAFLKNVNQWDILLSQNNYSSKIFRKAFHFNKSIVEIGYPRNDRLLNTDTNIERERLKRERGWTNKRIVLYAPTWRDDKHLVDNVYDFDLYLDNKRFIESFDEDVILVIRAHYLNVIPKYRDSSGRVVVSDPQDDLRDLMVMSDLLITDYSSIMFDYSLLSRPMVFFAYDVEYYRDKLRGFYFDLSDVAPGPIVTDNESLIEALQGILLNEKKYWERYGERYFSFRNTFNHADNGKASQKVIQLLFNHQ